MKINHRIILVNLLIVAIVLGSAAIAFYSIMYNTLTAQQSKIIISSSRNFIFTYRSFIDKIDEEFWTLKNNNPEFFFWTTLYCGKPKWFFSWGKYYRLYYNNSPFCKKFYTNTKAKFYNWWIYSVKSICNNKYQKYCPWSYFLFWENYK